MNRAVEDGTVQLMLESQVRSIGTDTATLSWRGEERTIPNDIVIVCAGGVLPTQFLHDIGINVETKFGTV